MKDSMHYSTYEDNVGSEPILHEPVAAYAAGSIAIPEDMAYARIENGVLQITSDIEEELAAVEHGETVPMDKFKTMFARWL